MKVPRQDFITARGGTQAVLDLTNPAVQDFIFYTVDTLLTRYPAIEYIKWDANMPVLNHGSVHLGKDETEPFEHSLPSGIRRGVPTHPRQIS